MRSRTEIVYFLTFLLLISTFAGVYAPEKQLEELGERPIIIGRITNSGIVNYSGNFV